MGRRIPKSRKHKKIKAVDPFYRGERKPTDNDVKRNKKPLNPSEQEIPRKLKEIMEGQHKINEKRRKKRKTQTSMYNEGDDCGPGVKGCDREPQPILTFKKKAEETDESYIQRLQFDALNAITQAKVESKFGVSYSETEGKLEHDKSSNYDLHKTMPMSLSRVKTTNKKLKQKKFRDAKKKKKLATRNKQKDDFHHLKDDIKFGVVAERPPMLSVLPRKAAANSQANLKRKKTLLLSKLLESTDKECDTSADFSKRRKYLSIAMRRKLDTERERVVQAYRDLKSKQKK